MAKVKGDNLRVPGGIKATEKPRCKPRSGRPSERESSSLSRMAALSGTVVQTKAAVDSRTNTSNFCLIASTTKWLVQRFATYFATPGIRRS